MAKEQFIVEVDLERKFWRIRSCNGEILMHSETYNTNQSARKIAKKFQKHLRGSKYREVGNAYINHSKKKAKK